MIANAAALALGGLLLTSRAAASETVTLAWDASPDTNVVGYAIYYGTNSGDYRQRLDVQDTLSGTVSNLVPGLRYYFVVTGYTAEALESLPSNEVWYLVPGALKVSQTQGRGLGMISFQGQPGENIIVQASEDLVQWKSLYELQSLTAQDYQIVDPASGSMPKRFYRLLGTNVASRKLKFSKITSAQVPKLSFVGAAGKVVQVQASDDRVNWKTLYQVVATTNQWFDFVDPNPTLIPMRFYRIIVQGQPSADVTYLGPGALRCEKVSGQSLVMLRFPTQIGETLSVQASADLVNWTTLQAIQPAPSYDMQIIDSAPATLTRRFYRLQGTNVVQRKLTISRITAPHLARLKFVAPPGDDVEIQASENLVNWTSIQTLRTTTNQWHEFIDPASASLPRRFYRIALPE